MENNIKYIIGDATNPIGDGLKVICHINNDCGAWGAGFVLSLSKRWKEPEMEYRKLGHSELKLGAIQLMLVEDDIIVANMIAQHGILSNKILPIKSSYTPPIRYDALKITLEKVNKFCIENNASLHMPRIGTGLAGGKWEIIEDLINKTITVDVYVYDLL